MILMLRLLSANDTTMPANNELLENTLVASRRNNAGKSITGVVLVGEGVFLQILEREATAV